MSIVNSITINLCEINQKTNRIFSDRQMILKSRVTKQYARTKEKFFDNRIADLVIIHGYNFEECNT